MAIAATRERARGLRPHIGAKKYGRRQLPLLLRAGRRAVLLRRRADFRPLHHRRADRGLADFRTRPTPFACAARLAGDGERERERTRAPSAPNLDVVES